MTEREKFLAFFRREAAQWLDEYDPTQALTVLRVLDEMSEVIKTIDWTATSARQVAQKCDPVFAEFGITPGHLVWLVVMCVIAGPPSEEQFGAVLAELVTPGESRCAAG